jgi:hypothetical protein
MQVPLVKISHASLRNASPPPCLPLGIQDLLKEDTRLLDEARLLDEGRFLDEGRLFDESGVSDGEFLA